MADAPQRRGEYPRPAGLCIAHCRTPSARCINADNAPQHGRAFQAENGRSLLDIARGGYWVLLKGMAPLVFGLRSSILALYPPAYGGCFHG